MVELSSAQNDFRATGGVEKLCYENTGGFQVTEKKGFTALKKMILTKKMLYTQRHRLDQLDHTQSSQKRGF